MKECQRLVKELMDMYGPDEERHYSETYDIDADPSTIRTQDLKPHIYKTLRQLQDMANAQNSTQPKKWSDPVRRILLQKKAPTKSEYNKAAKELWIPAYSTGYLCGRCGEDATASTIKGEALCRQCYNEYLKSATYKVEKRINVKQHLRSNRPVRQHRRSR